MIGTTVERWEFVDLKTDERLTLPVNPNTATSPSTPKTITFAQGASPDASGIHRPRAMQAPSGPAQWDFGGPIYNREQHDQLLAWAKKENPVRVSDHLGRAFVVIIEKFRPVDRRPTATKPWRQTYTMTVLILRRAA